jgi:hypothetical protein
MYDDYSNPFMVVVGIRPETGWRQPFASGCTICHLLKASSKLFEHKKLPLWTIDPSGTILIEGGDLAMNELPSKQP